MNGIRVELWRESWKESDEVEDIDVEDGQKKAQGGRLSQGISNLVRVLNHCRQKEYTLVLREGAGVN